MSLLAALASAQSYQGGLRGTVSDPGAAVVAEAKVTLTNEATSVGRSTLSNVSGEFAFNAVEPATYTVSVESPGFKRFERKGIVVATQQFLTIDSRLEVGEVTDSVLVKEEIPLIENATASNGQVLDRQKMIDLPNLGRNPFLLSKLATNVVAAGDPRFNRFQDQSGSSQISVAGGPVRGNNYLLDGVPITDFQNRAVIIPTVESVQEMKLQSNTYDAEMGRTGGGVFNAYLKSGTNEYHGALFGATRQTDWLANNFFLNRAGTARPDTPYYNYGGAFGGPVSIPHVYRGKDRTFFWIADEGYRQKSGLSNDLSAPTLLERKGDFSQSKSSAGGALLIYDPLSGTARTAFPGSVIPTARLNPVGLAIAGYYPTPSRTASAVGGRNFTGSDILADKGDEFTSKADHRMFSWWQVNASYLHYKSREPNGNLVGTAPGSASTLLYRKVDATQINNILTPSPTTVISIRWGFNRFPNQTDEVSKGFDMTTLGFPASFVGATQTRAFPAILSQNMVQLGGSGTSQSVYYSRNFLVSVSKFMGRHSLKAGFDYRKINVDFTDLTTAPGTFSFDDGFTRKDPTKSDGSGADIASMLLGYAASGSAQTSTKLYTFVNYYAGYIHDDFRFNSKLTVNFGVRYEYETGLTERNNNFVVGFDRTQVNPLASQVTGILPYGQLLFAGVKGAATACCGLSDKKVAPRFGFAYQWNSKTTFRGGYGIFYAPMRYTADATFAAGFTQTTPYVSSNDGGYTPASSLSNPFPAGLQAPTGSSQGGLTGTGSNVNFLDQGLGNGMVHQFSFDIQRELPGNIALQVGFVGSRSNHLQASSTSNGLININQVPTQFLSLGAALNNKVANPYYLHGGTGILSGSTVTQAQLLKPYSAFGNLSAGTNFNHSRYDSLIVKLQKRMSAGFTFLTTYTWSRSMDASFGGTNFLNAGSGSATFPQNYYDLGSEYSLSTVNTPHRLVVTGTYELPFGKGKHFLTNPGVWNYLIGGWQANAIGTFQTGFPLVIVQSSNLNSVIGAQMQRPNATGVSPETSGDLGSRLNNYINPLAFSQAAQFTFGNVSRSIGYRGPGQANWDISLFKDFKFKERVNAQFRAEALNAMNTPLFRGPATTFGSSSFGAITQQANFPRFIQLGFRVQF